MNESQREELARILAEVRGLELRSRRFIHDVVTGGYESAFRGAGMEFDEVREYVEGDDPRSIDWNVTARTGNPHVKKFLEERVESDCNQKVARYQTIKKITVLENVFSVDSGELTPTLKVRRNIVNEKYAAQIDAFYDAPKDKLAATA